MMVEKLSGCIVSTQFDWKSMYVKCNLYTKQKVKINATSGPGRRVLTFLHFSFYNPDILRYNRYSTVERKNKY